MFHCRVRVDLDRFSRNITCLNVANTRQIHSGIEWHTRSHWNQKNKIDCSSNSRSRHTVWLHIVTHRTVKEQKTRNQSSKQKCREKKEATSNDEFDLLTHTFVFDGYYLLFCHLNGNVHGSSTTKQTKNRHGPKNRCMPARARMRVNKSEREWATEKDEIAHTQKKVCKICFILSIIPKSWLDTVLNALPNSIRIGAIYCFFFSSGFSLFIQFMFVC